MDYQAAISRAGQMINFSIITQLYVRIEVWKLRGSGNRALVAIRLVITTILLLLSITANIFFCKYNTADPCHLYVLSLWSDSQQIHLRSTSDPSQIQIRPISESDLYHIQIISKSNPNQVYFRSKSDPNKIQIRSKSDPSKIRTRSKSDLNKIKTKSESDPFHSDQNQIQIRSIFEMFVLKMFAVILMPVCVSRSNLYVPIQPR